MHKWHRLLGMNEVKRVKKTIFILTIIGVILMLLMAFLLSTERNRAAWGSSGFIESGEKFSIKIGENKDKVTSHLIALGLHDVSEVGKNETHYNPKRCHGYTFSDEYTVEVWSDDSWRRGIICVAYKENNLERMSWNYGMFQP